MADTYYMWSRVSVGVKPDGRPEKVFTEGDEVTKATLKVDDATWDTWINEGVVRTMPYPETNGDSPVNYYYRQAKAMATLAQGMSDASSIDEQAAKEAVKGL
jgi:hypothetical protein